MSARFCPVEHEEDEFFRMMNRKLKAIKEINGRNYSIETTEWRCPVCEAEDILFEYSEEAYSEME